MKNTVKIAVGALIAVAIIGVGYWQVSSNRAEDGQKTIGVILPLSGQYADIGDKAEKAIRLAFKGEEGAKLVFEDSQFEIKNTVSAYQKLASVDQVDMVISLATIGAMEALDKQINDSKLLTIQITEANEPKDDYIFQVSPYSYPLFSRLGELADREYESVAIIYSNEEFGVKDANFFKQTFPKNKIVYEAPISSGTDYRTEVTKMLSTNPEAVTFFLTEDDGTKFLKEFIAQGGNQKTKLICNQLVEISIGKYIETFGAVIFEGCISTNIPTLTTEKFTQEFVAEYGVQPTFATDFAYDAALTARELISTSKSKWLAEIKKTSIDGASGKVEFDANGTRVPQIEERIFEGGKFIKQ